MEENVLARQFHTASLLRFALPNMIMMVFQSLYTIVDGMFVSRMVGTMALSAISMPFPINNVEMALGIMLATGGSAIIARKMGEGRDDQARRDFTCVVAAALVMGVLFMVICQTCLDPILHLLGVSELLWEDCVTYTRVLQSFAPAYFLQLAFQTLFVTAGKPMLGLGATVAGGLSNVVLDWLFMGPMGMGVGGAAVATGIGYSIPAVTGLIYFSFCRTGSLYFVPFRFRWRLLGQACFNGASQFVNNVALAITTCLFNLIFLEWCGEDGVASINIAMYFQYVFIAVFLGFSVGVAPIISYKYGAEDDAQLKRVIRTSMNFVLAASVASYLISLWSIGPALTLFTDPDTAVYALTIEGFPIYAAGHLFMGVSIFVSDMFVAFSDGPVSSVISFARSFVFLVAMLLLLPRVLGEIGIWLAVPAAELLGTIMAVICLIKYRKKYKYG